MNEAIIEKINHMIEQYNEKLAEKNITCIVQKKFFTISVGRSYTNGIDHMFDYENEKTKFRFQPNRYYCVIIKITPLDKNLLKKEFCKEYSFVLNKVERTFIGETPKKYQYTEEKILHKIEKLMQKILKKAKTQSTIEICKDNWRDLFRYINFQYAYKKKILGKDPYFWDIIFCIIIFIVIFLITLLVNLNGAF